MQVSKFTIHGQVQERKLIGEENRYHESEVHFGDHRVHERGEASVGVLGEGSAITRRRSR